MFNNGSNAEEAVCLLGRCKVNGAGAPGEVGAYRPNAFGLYDMHGNVWELCLDRVLHCVIDLSDGPTAEKYPVRYLDSVPKCGWTDEYKTVKLVLRKIEPGSFECLSGDRFRLTKTYYPWG